MAPARAPRLSESERALSTRKHILRVAVEHAASVGVENIRIDDVLRDAFASSSSLYHLFGNRAGLIDAMRVERQRLGLIEEDPSIIANAELITSHEEFCDYIASHLRRAITDPSARRRRQARLEATVAGFESPDVARKSAILQSMMLGITAQLMKSAIERGLCNPDLDALGYATFFVSLSLGRFTTESAVDDERWLAVAIPAALAPLRITG